MVEGLQTKRHLAYSYMPDRRIWVWLVYYIYDVHGKEGSKDASQNGQNGEASSDLLSWGGWLGTGEA